MAEEDKKQEDRTREILSEIIQEEEQSGGNGTEESAGEPAEQQSAAEGSDTGDADAAEDTDTYQGPETPEQLMAAVESILFAMGDSVDVPAMAKALKKSTKEINDAVDRLTEKYDSPSSGLMIQRFDDAVQMSTRPEQYPNLIRIAKVPKKITLSDSVIETLSIIAYRQPITKAEVEQIRGVSCDYAINKLLDYDLVHELGRKDAPGRPILFGTTEQFLRTFGVKNLSELPSLNTVQVEEFKEEAEAEVDQKLGV